METPSAMPELDLTQLAQDMKELLRGQVEERRSRQILELNVQESFGEIKERMLGLEHRVFMYESPASTVTRQPGSLARDPGIPVLRSSSAVPERKDSDSEPEPLSSMEKVYREWEKTLC